MSVVGVDRLANWERLSDAGYRAKRSAWLDAVIARLDTEWPGFGGAVAQRDMATARTMHDFLNTPGGVIYGFAPNVPDRMRISVAPRTPKNVSPRAVAGLRLRRLRRFQWCHGCRRGGGESSTSERLTKANRSLCMTVWRGLRFATVGEGRRPAIADGQRRPKSTPKRSPR